MNTVQIKSKHSVGGMFIFFLIGVYTVFLLLLVLTGAGAYRNAVDNASHTAQVRTSLGYIANKVRAADQAGGVSIEQWQGVQALLIRERHDDAEYNTRIYYLPNADGAPGGGLYEQFVYSGDVWPLEEGDRIADIASLDMSVDINEESSLLLLRLQTQDGRTLPLHIRLYAAAR